MDAEACRRWNQLFDLTSEAHTKFAFVGDRGFFSERNLKLLSENGYKFTIPAPSNVGWQKELIAEHRDTLVHPNNILEDRGSIMYGKTVYKTTDHGHMVSYIRKIPLHYSHILDACL